MTYIHGLGKDSSEDIKLRTRQLESKGLKHKTRLGRRQTVNSSTDCMTSSEGQGSQQVTGRRGPHPRTAQVSWVATWNTKAKILSTRDMLSLTAKVNHARDQVLRTADLVQRCPEGGHAPICQPKKQSAKQVRPSRSVRTHAEKTRYQERSHGPKSKCIERKPWLDNNSCCFRGCQFIGYWNIARS